MEVFKSWADIVIMLVIAIAYVITYFVQRTTIKNLNIRIDALTKTNTAHSELASSLGEDIRAYKEMIKLEDINEHISIQVSVRLQNYRDNFYEDFSKTLLSDREFLQKVSDMMAEEITSFYTSNLLFLLYIFKKNKFSEEKIQDIVDTFFKDTPWIYGEIMSRLPTFLTNSNDTFEPDKQIDQN